MGRDTLHSRQAEYEKTLYRKPIRNDYCYKLDRMVGILGKDRSPEDVFRSDLEALRVQLKEKYNIKGRATMALYMRCGRAFYDWMDIMEYVPIGFNPFRVYDPNGRSRKRRELYEMELNLS